MYHLLADFLLSLASIVLGEKTNIDYPYSYSFPFIIHTFATRTSPSATGNTDLLSVFEHVIYIVGCIGSQDTRKQCVWKEWPRVSSDGAYRKDLRRENCRRKPGVLGTSLGGATFDHTSLLNALRGTSSILPSTHARKRRRKFKHACNRPTLGEVCYISKMHSIYCMKMPWGTETGQTNWQWAENGGWAFGIPYTSWSIMFDVFRFRDIAIGSTFRVREGYTAPSSSILCPQYILIRRVSH